MGAALLGGASWVAHYFVVEPALSWAGAALLTIALAAVGVGLVRQLWLKLIAAAGAVLLAWSVIELAREAGNDDLVQLVAGGIATLLVAIAVMRGSGTHHGNH